MSRTVLFVTETLGDLPVVGGFFRRLFGGHWEQWWVEPCAADVWHRVERCSLETGTRPSGVCMGTPRCESW